MNYQRIILAGNATGDAEQKTSKKGDVRFTTFSVGVSEGEDSTTFFPVTVFGEFGEAIAQHITKGRELLVDGRITVSEKGYFNVVADRVRLGSDPRKHAKSAKK
jgi:single-stranded DNA-binding protein